MRPIIARSRRKTPHAMMPPMISIVAIRAAALPYAATPISINATICKKGKNTYGFTVQGPLYMADSHLNALQ